MGLPNTLRNRNLYLFLTCFFSGVEVHRMLLWLFLLLFPLFASTGILIFLNSLKQPVEQVLIHKERVTISGMRELTALSKLCGSVLLRYLYHS